jgi:hypothetical protein
MKVGIIIHKLMFCKEKDSDNLKFISQFFVRVKNSDETFFWDNLNAGSDKGEAAILGKIIERKKEWLVGEDFLKRDTFLPEIVRVANAGDKESNIIIISETRITSVDRRGATEGWDFHSTIYVNRPMGYPVVTNTFIDPQEGMMRMLDTIAELYTPHDIYSCRKDTYRDVAGKKTETVSPPVNFPVISGPSGLHNTQFIVGGTGITELISGVISSMRSGNAPIASYDEAAQTEEELNATKIESTKSNDTEDERGAAFEGPIEGMINLPPFGVFFNHNYTGPAPTLDEIEDTLALIFEQVVEHFGIELPDEETDEENQNDNQG